MRASSDGAVAARRTALVGYWVATVVFVAGVAVLQGWIAPLGSAVPAPGLGGDATESPESTATPVTLHGGATVTFPAGPEESMQFLEIAGSEVVLRLHSATAGDGATYNMGVVTYPPQVNLADPATNLLASVSGAAGNVNGRVVRQEVTLYQGAPAVEFLVEADDVQLLARHVLDGRRLYAQNVAYREADEPAAADDFFDSLELAPTVSPSPSPSPSTSPTPGFEPTPADL